MNCRYRDGDTPIHQQWHHLWYRQLDQEWHSGILQQKINKLNACFQSFAFFLFWEKWIIDVVISIVVNIYIPKNSWQHSRVKICINSTFLNILEFNSMKSLEWRYTMASDGHTRGQLNKRSMLHRLNTPHMRCRTGRHFRSIWKKSLNKRIVIIIVQYLKECDKIRFVKKLPIKNL